MVMDSFLLYCLSTISDDAEKSKFERLYYAYRHTMLYVANNVLRDQSLAEDAVQEAFLRIIGQLDKINEADCHKTKGFLVIIVKNISINMYNKRKKQGEVFLFDDMQVTTPYATSLAEDEDGVRRIAAMIQTLPEIYAHILSLRYLYDLGDKDCAQLLKLSPATVRKRLERGRKLLKEQLEKEGVSL